MTTWDRPSRHAHVVRVLGAIFVGLPAGAIGGAVVPIGQPLYEAANVVRKTPDLMPAGRSTSLITSSLVSQCH
jgi:hypothetical protein